MQNKHWFFFLFGNPNVRGGGGGQAGWAKFPTFTKNLFWMLPLCHWWNPIRLFTHTMGIINTTWAIEWPWANLTKSSFKQCQEYWEAYQAITEHWLCNLKGSSAKEIRRFWGRLNLPWVNMIAIKKNYGKCSYNCQSGWRRGDPSSSSSEGPRQQRLSCSSCSCEAAIRFCCMQAAGVKTDRAIFQVVWHLWRDFSPQKQ